jgi:cyclopropane-fatty-acyl-phospholipid synthase
MVWLYRRILDLGLKGLIRRGRLTVTWPDGMHSDYGNGEGFAAGIRINTTATLRHLAFNPGLALGEAYMDEGITVTSGTIHDVLSVVMDNQNDASMPALRWQERIGWLLRPIRQANNARRAKRNVAHHYDLNGRLYSLFLDRDRQYSCAYFPRGDETLEEAQSAKKHHIAAKLKLDRPGLTVLDIGCGWGGMALTLARDYGARVTGITLSEEQLAAARARAVEAGLQDLVTFELLDYRAVDRQFDRIVSVGMFEHVGVPNYKTFFQTIKNCLKPNGVAVLHSIGRFEGPGSTNPWIAKYIFPGGYSPALSEVLGPIERSGLVSTDIEILRLHYAKTIAHWRRRFAANLDAITTIYDDRFRRMFEFYLSASELAFRLAGHMNFQIQLTRHQEALPLARDYIYEQEQHAKFASAGE